MRCNAKKSAGQCRQKCRDTCQICSTAPERTLLIPFDGLSRRDTVAARPASSIAAWAWPLGLMAFVPAARQRESPSVPCLVLPTPLCHRRGTERAVQAYLLVDGGWWGDLEGG